LTSVSELLPASISRAMLLMIEPVITSETSANFYETARSNNPEDCVIFILSAVRTLKLSTHVLVTGIHETNSATPSIVQCLPYTSAQEYPFCYGI
jgi:hypothetical protein